tara:strand:- start:4674 stop:5138 length:465 start_codon:yes stop_codon:yes gene_type:complete
MVEPPFHFCNLPLLDHSENLSKFENVRRLMGRLPRKSLPAEKKLTPAQVGRLRADIMSKVSEQLLEAHEVVMGRHEEGWNPTQARVFAALLNKVMPDLTAQFVQHEHLMSESPEKLSRAQLEEIAMGVNNIIDVDVVEEEIADADSTGSSTTPS